MSDNERKTWIMYKKADTNKYIQFTSDIAPALSSNNQGTDKYGVWTCKSSGQWQTGSIYQIFDKINSGRTTPDATVQDRYCYAELILPENVYIAAEEFMVNGKKSGASFVFRVQGSVDGGEYEDIISNTALPTSQKDTFVTVANTPKYYNKFRLAVYNTKRDSMARYAYISEFQITKGTLKVINGLA
jgi:hypothetical protein